MPSSRRPHLPLWLAPLLLPLPVLAQNAAPPATSTPDAPKSSEAAPQRIEVKGSYDARRQDTASKTVVTRDEILRYGDTSLSDVLKRLPGVSLGGGGIRFRGLGNGYTQILLNGEPAPPGFQIDNLAPDSIEKIEILRAASAEFSTQSIAGTINIITRKTVTNTQREFRLTAAADGSHLDRRGTFANLTRSDKAGALSYTLNANLAHGTFEQATESEMLGVDAQGVPDLETHTRRQNSGSFDGIFFAPRLNWKLAGGDTLASQSFLRFNRSHTAASEETQFVLGNAPMNLNNQSRNNSEIINFNTNLNWLHTLKNGSRLDLKLGLNFANRVSDSRFLGFDPDYRPTLQRDTLTRSADLGATLVGKLSHNTGNGHTLVLGWDGGYSQKRDYRRQHDTLPAGGDPDRFVAFDQDQRFIVRVSRLALFGQDEWNVSKDWSVYLGLRGEGVQTTSGGDAVASARNHYTVISPIAQTLYKIPGYKNTQLRFALSRTYKAPAINNLNGRLVTSSQNSATSPDTRGNPNLRPELASGLDATFEHFLGEGGLISLNTFVRRITDVNGTGLFLVNGRYVSTPINQGDALSRGIELEAKFPLRAVWQTAPAIDFRFNLNRNWSRVSSLPGPDNRLDGQTPLSANLGLDWRVKDWPLTLGGNFNFQTAGQVRNSLSQTGFASVTRNLDAYVLWKIDPKNQLRVAVANLLHQDLVNENRVFDASGSVTQRSSTANPASLRVTLEHKF